MDRVEGAGVSTQSEVDSERVVSSGSPGQRCAVELAGVTQRFVKDGGRQAFTALFQDPLFLREAKTSGMSLDPESGEYIGKLTRELRALPPDVIAAARTAAGD